MNETKLNNVQKRDGRYVDFDKYKIIHAVLAAFEEVDGEITEYARTKAENIAEYIESRLKERSYSVEEIQDLVEQGLMSCKRKDVAKAYILFRNKRTKERERRTQWYKDFNAKLRGTNIENQNANVDERTFGGRKGEADAIMMCKIALEEYISPKFAENHIQNRVYIHDLREYASGMTNCLSIPFDHLLRDGFKTRSQNVRPAGSLATAMQLVAVIFQLQSLVEYGGTSATHLDWTLVPYVRKSFYKHFLTGLKWIEGIEEYSDVDNATSIDSPFYKKYEKVYNFANAMINKEAHQAAEGLLHNLNTLQSLA